MTDSMYPKCGKCGEGTLLPFFNEKGANHYACTKCERVFSSGFGNIKGSWKYVTEYLDKN